MLGAQMFLEYVDWIGAGDATRLDAAEHFGVHKTTATYHLERAVSEGYLVRIYTWAKANQTGWAYRAPQSVDRFEWPDYGEESESDERARAAVDDTPYL